MMKTISRFLPVLFLLPLSLSAQVRGAEFQITKITKNLISSPQFSYTGANQYQANLRDQWLELEVTFNAVPEVADDLTFKYFILINGKVLTGEVTHSNVLAGKDHRSVMYVTPRALARFNSNRPVTTVTVPNVAVQIVQQGTVKDELSLVRAPAQWYSSLQAVNGFVLNKDQTPFAPLYWDRYEQIKVPAAR